MVKTNVDFPSEAVRCQVRTLLQSRDSLAEMQCSGPADTTEYSN
jgi:hypothetical protein